MEDVVAVSSLKVLKSPNLKALLVVLRISGRRQNDTDSRIIREAKINLIQPSVNARLKDIDNIILHSRQHNLRFRIPESRVIFQHLRAILGQHQPAEENSRKRPSLRLHRVHGRLINVLLAEFLHILRIERTRRERTHTSGIQALIPVLRALMILSARHGLNMSSVAERQN